MFSSGPFTLTHLLKDLLVCSGEPGDPSRVVFVSSYINNFMRRPTSIDAGFLKGPGGSWGSVLQYANSKLLQIYTSNALAVQFEEEGVHCQSVSLHPGKDFVTLS